MPSSQQTEGKSELVRNGLQDCDSLPWPSVTCPYFRRYGMGGLQPTLPQPRLGVANVPGTPAAVVTLACSTWR
jgi:hypothetical protein